MPIRQVKWVDGRRVIVETPMVCTARQARVAMLQTPYQGFASLLHAVQSAVDASDDPALQIAWEYGIEWTRNDPYIAALSASLGLSSDDVDGLFVRAMTL